MSQQQPKGNGCDPYNGPRAFWRPGDLLRCKKCRKLTTELEVSLRKFNEGQCEHCGGDLESEFKGQA